jgi:integrase
LCQSRTGDDFAISAFTVLAVEKWINRMLKDGVTPPSINRARAALRELLKLATRENLLARNPVMDVACIREKKAKVDPFTFEEVRLFLDALRHDPQMRNFYRLAFATGLRPSELLALKWSDIDWHSIPPAIAIERAFTKADGMHDTKTAQAENTVELLPPALAALKDQQALTRLRGEFVFCNRDGGVLDRDNIANRVWYPTLKRAGLRRRTPYQTKHTFATLAMQNGKDAGWVARQLRHANIEMVIRHYFRWMPAASTDDHRCEAGMDSAAGR